MLDSMRCKKCGLTQRTAPTCKSCGAAGVQTANIPSSRPTRPAPPPPQRSETVHAPTAPRVAEPHDLDTGSGDSRRLTFFGSGGTLFGIHVVNVFRTLITLGVYHFWGKVRVRAFLLSQSEFEGDRFAYHGTGKELLIGFLKGGLVFGTIMALFNSVPFLPGGVPVQAGVMIGAYALLLMLIPIAMVGARRYRLSRISWRNIRFSFQGRAKAFIPIFAGGLLLTGLTLGFYYPFWATARQAFMVSHSHFGNQAFGFDGRGRALFLPFLLALLLTIPTLGLSWVWFAARRQRYWWDHTSFGAARFRSTVTGWRLLRLHAGNLLLLVLTLGLGWAWVTVWRARFEFDNLALDGALDLAAIHQDARDASATGEGLDLLLDMDTGLATG
ncbi:MAG: DUF898 family protein [Nitrospirota bacterium]